MARSPSTTSSRCCWCPNVIDKAAYPSEKKCEDEKILEVMKFAAMKKKSKKAKKAKKTEA